VNNGGSGAPLGTSKFHKYNRIITTKNLFYVQNYNCIEQLAA